MRVDRVEKIENRDKTCYFPSIYNSVYVVDKEDDSDESVKLLYSRIDRSYPVVIENVDSYKNLSFICKLLFWLRHNNVENDVFLKTEKDVVRNVYESLILKTYKNIKVIEVKEDSFTLHSSDK